MLRRMYTPPQGEYPEKEENIKHHVLTPQRRRQTLWVGLIVLLVLNLTLPHTKTTGKLSKIKETKSFQTFHNPQARAVISEQKRTASRWKSLASCLGTVEVRGTGAHQAKHAISLRWEGVRGGESQGGWKLRGREQEGREIHRRRVLGACMDVPLPLWLTTRKSSTCRMPPYKSATKLLPSGAVNWIIPIHKRWKVRGGVSVCETETERQMRIRMWHLRAHWCVPETYQRNSNL